jgi:prepilin signal peptidase PulO-like enzyme (type II secretory pathway)
LIIIFVYDLKYLLIPDKVVWPGFVLALLFSLINTKVTFWQSILGAALLGGFFLVLILVSRERWMGWGDAKLGLFIGALLGWKVAIFTLFLAFVVGAVIGVVLVAAERKEWKSKVPFGTFMSVSTFVAILWGEEIVGWYLGVLGF